MKYFRRHGHVSTWALAAIATIALPGCGTLTGIPAHGGGKRFATEQRLVSASIRASLKDLDLSSLRGKRAALVFDLISDEGGGTLSGGRWTPGLLFSVGNVANPVTTTSNAFQVYNLAGVGTNYSNSTSSGGSTTVGTTTQTGTSETTGSSQTTGTSSSSTTGSSSNTSTTDSTTNSSTSGNSTTTTNGITTDNTFGQNETSSTSSTTNASGSSTGSTTGSSTSNTTTSSSTASSSTTSATSQTTNTSDGQTTGGSRTSQEAITPAPTQSVTTSSGTRRENVATLQYRGLGEYQNFMVPKSDASLLMGLVRNYMMLNGILPTTPTDPNADVLVYVTVDIFGIVRSRFDAVLYNNETVRAETSFEVMAFDRSGKLLLRPQVANREAQYREHYLLWVGPVTTKERVYEGDGLLVDFRDVDPQTGNAAWRKSAEVSHSLGKN